MEIANIRFSVTGKKGGNKNDFSVWLESGNNSLYDFFLTGGCTVEEACQIASECDTFFKSLTRKYTGKTPEQKTNIAVKTFDEQVPGEKLK